MKSRNTLSVTSTLNVRSMAIVLKFMEQNNVKKSYGGVASFATELCADWIQSKTGIDVDFDEAWNIIDEVMPKSMSKKNAMRKLVSLVANDNPDLADMMAQRAGGVDVSQETQEALDLARHVSGTKRPAGVDDTSATEEQARQHIIEKYKDWFTRLREGQPLEPRAIVLAYEKLRGVTQLDVAGVAELCDWPKDEFGVVLARAELALMDESPAAGTV